MLPTFTLASFEFGFPRANRTIAADAPGSEQQRAASIGQ
jgi:hypothetical protein